MKFPTNLRIAIDEHLSGVKQLQLKKIAQDLSMRYRNESGHNELGKRLLTRDDEALVYSIVRMPATFGAVSDALQYALDLYPIAPKTLLDVGAGTGSASWACDSILELDTVTCLEREGAMRKIGQELMKEGSESLQKAKWISADLINDEINEQADIVVSSYVMNEMPEKDRELVLNKLWNACNQMLLIIEPGTPVAFKQLKKARNILLEKGAHIAAPCPHEQQCRIAEEDWCHFTCRIQRSKTHKLLKDGDVPYEDEKYTYMAFIKQSIEHNESRILRHPYIEKGQITLDICNQNENKSVTVKKKDGAVFKAARKAKCGDSIEL